MDETLRTLNNGRLSRNDIKPYFANLTIGSGAVAAIVCHRSLAGGMQESDLMRLAGWRSPAMLRRYGASSASERAIAAAKRHSTSDEL